jgi:voltage-gated potassium channel
MISPARRFLFAIAGLLMLTAIGTAGYIVIEQMSFVDALYMSVITISTVGFGEVKPLGAEGRLFTIFLIVTGVGTALYLFTTAAELVFEGRLREFLGATAMHRKIHQLDGHVIVCGFGRFGRVVVEELLQNGLPLVVIDPDPAVATELERLGIPRLSASALDDDALEEAGIHAARAIVAATPSDADNVYITLTAREKNPRIQIHARAESEGGMRRLRLAGAHQVVSVFRSGGMRIAATILRPTVVDFLELAMAGRGDEVDLEEIRVAPGSNLIGKRIQQAEQEIARLRIVALKRGTDRISIIPDPATPIQSGDHLVAIGDRNSLKRLAESINR